jgi:hypothetical protein
MPFGLIHDIDTGRSSLRRGKAFAGATGRAASGSPSLPAK